MPPLTEVAADLLERLGYAGLAALVAFEQVFPPLPSEVVLPLAGLLVADGRLAFVPAVLAATAGSVLGALGLYVAARQVGQTRLERWVAAHGRWVLLRPADLAAARAWFARHGDAAVLVGRVVPGVRSLVSLPAGISGMPLPRFLALTAVGSAAWNAALIAAGMVLGEAAQGGGPVLQAVEALVALVVLALVLRFVARRLGLLPRAPREAA